jgi:hypothetical protein
VHRDDLGALEADADAVLTYLGLPLSPWSVDRP